MSKIVENMENQIQKQLFGNNTTHYSTNNFNTYAIVFLACLTLILICYIVV